MKNQKGFSAILVLLGVVVILILGLYYVILNTQEPTTSAARKDKSSTEVYTGNKAPSGPHYNLNIIGVPKDKKADMTGSSGHRIFVPLKGNCKIMLSEGDYQVLDGNCTDSNQASFQLPNPDPENDGVTEYSVWARALGKPGGKSTTTTCATEVATGDEYCSVYSLIEVREKGKSSFSDVSKELLYVYVDLDGDGMVERYNLFADELEDYFWNYDNNGMKLLQLRFYQVPSVVD